MTQEEAFKSWWYNEGSQAPYTHHDCEEHTMRMCEIAWNKAQSLAQPEQDAVAMKFKIYKPTVPDPTRQDINNALLPWVYDQDRSSGFAASMWVTPVATLPPQRTWVGLSDEELADCMDMSIQKTCRAIEAKLKQKNGYTEEKNT